MWKDLLRAALLAIIGTGLLLTGQSFAGAGLILISLGSAAAGWWFRNAPPLDPALEAEIGKALDVRKANRAAGDHMLERAFAESAAREERELAELRDSASRDRRAAVDLRNRLRAKLKFGARARRRIERILTNAPGRAAVLAELDRRTAIAQQRLVEAEQHLQRLPT